MATVFSARSVELSGGFAVDRPVDEVFELFSPLGETRWVPGWEPELLHPQGVSWARGLIFRTREARGEVVWIVTALEYDAHAVEYHRVEPGRYVARVSVRCAAQAERRTQVTVSYAFVGLSDEGNQEIALMTPASYAQKMQRWTDWIAEHFAPLS